MNTMTIIKWKTSRFIRDGITRVECTRETAETVWFGVRKAPKAGATAYHDTWEAARAYLMDRAQLNVAAARRALEVANSTLGNVKGMRPPAA